MQELHDKPESMHNEEVEDSDSSEEHSILCDLFSETDDRGGLV